MVTKVNTSALKACVDGTDVSRSLEHGLLFWARDIEIAVNRKMIGGDTMLDYAGKKQSLFLSIENPVKYVSALVNCAVTLPVQG